MFPEMPSRLSLAKIISGLSKTLNIAQQVIPIYEQTKPMVSSARKAFSILKDLDFSSLTKKSSNLQSKQPLNITEKPLKKTTFKKSSFMGPKFFK